MSGDTIERLDRFIAPYRQEVTLSKVTFESGMQLMRVAIREGHRITQLDIDKDTAAHWASVMADWAAASNDATGGAAD
ncbi:MAG: hypothetical protein C0606_04720 [Hyphomicrobiales bacterium]|nr:MAG: hypothetical protein C0606_04720 [Hyphomicrobiales bacterium]